MLEKSKHFSHVFKFEHADIRLSYDPYVPASTFFAKPWMKAFLYEGRMHLRECGRKSRMALLQKRAASRVETSSKFVSKIGHMI